MTLDELSTKSILILGFGTEGQATYEFLRQHWPEKTLTIADRQSIDSFPEEITQRLQNDPEVRLNFGPRYLDSVDAYWCQVMIKTPGIPASIGAIVRARQAGCILTSHSQIFLENYPREHVIGVTGTKGKSTTASLIHHILKHAGIPAELVGNIGRPPLALIDSVPKGTYFVHEFSSHQLAEIETSPHIAVLLNIVPEHLDYYATFEEYVAAKENITRFQAAEDFLIFNPEYPVPAAIASRSRAQLRLFGNHQDIIDTRDIPLLGSFNIQNVLAAAAVASLFEIASPQIGEAIRSFRPLPHRLEPVGTYKGVEFYDDSIATVPDATLAALDALGRNVQTLILGGHERNLDYSDLGSRLPANIRTVILFPTTGQRIWDAIKTHSRSATKPEPFFVSDIDHAVSNGRGFPHIQPRVSCARRHRKPIKSAVAAIRQ